MSAENDNVFGKRERVGHRLVEDVAVGRSENHLVVVAFAHQMLNAAVHRLNLHHHAGLAAERIVVHFFVLAKRPVAQVVHMYFHKPLVLGALQN